MSYTVNDQRKQTMLKRLGDAVELIDDQRFLPFYRSIQIKLERDNHPDEWGKMIALAKTKEHASRYFAKLCKMVRDNTYRFIEAVKEVAGEAKLWLHDKLVRFGFGKYQKYWVNRGQEYINKNGQAAFVELLEYVERKGLPDKYIARALKNGQAPRQYYQNNVLSTAK